MDISQYKPKGKINNKHLLTLRDYSSSEIFEILHRAALLKNLNRKGKKQKHLKGKTVALIFAKSSTRTRVSFEQGVRQLGGTPLFLSSADIQLGRGETIHDTVKVLQRYGIDAIMIRTFKQSDLDELALYGSIPIINGLTDDFHPCQVLADLMTVYERYGRLEGLKLAYFGDGNNMANSLMLGCAKVGMKVCICSPKGFTPSEDIAAEAKKFGECTVTADINEAAKDADVIYTDVFFSMGQDADKKKKAALMPYQVNESVMALAAKDAVFMHCLPAHRGEEVTADVIDSPRSVIFEQAENRLHAQKAVMSLLIR